MTTTLLPGLLKTVARNVGRGADLDLALFETGHRARCRTPAGRRRSYGVDRRPTEDEWDDLDKALPAPAAAPRRRRHR